MIFDTIDPVPATSTFAAFRHILHHLQGHTPWSLAELNAAEADYQWLIRWIQSPNWRFILRDLRSDIPTNLGDYGFPRVGHVPFRLSRGLVLFFLECEHARRSDNPSFWQAIAALPWPDPVREYLFTAGGAAKQEHRTLICDVAKFFKLRHVFDGNPDDNRWHRCAFLQFGFSNGGAMDQVPLWLRGQNQPVAVNDLLHSDSLVSESFGAMWGALKSYSLYGGSRAEARRRIEGSPWIVKKRIDALLDAVAPSIQPDQQIVVFGDTGRLQDLGITVRLLWDEVAFVAKLPAFDALPPADNVYRLKWNGQCVSNYIRQSDGHFEWTQNPIRIPHTCPTGSLSLETDGGTIAAVQEIELWDPYEFVTLFRRQGAKADNAYCANAGNDFSIIFSADLHPTGGNDLQVQVLCEGWCLLRLSGDTAGDPALRDQQDVVVWEAAQVLPQNLQLLPLVSVTLVTPHQDGDTWTGAVRWNLPQGFQPVRLLVNRAKPISLSPNDLEAQIRYTPGDLWGLIRLTLFVREQEGRCLAIHRSLPVRGIECVLRKSSDGDVQIYKSGVTLVLGKGGTARIRIRHPFLEEEAGNRMCLLEGTNPVSAVSAQPFQPERWALRGYGAPLRALERVLNANRGSPTVQVAANCQDCGKIETVQRCNNGQTIRIHLLSPYQVSRDHKLFFWTSTAGIVERQVPLEQHNTALVELPAQLANGESLHAVGLLWGQTFAGSWFQKQMWWTQLEMEMDTTTATSIAAFCRLFKAPLLAAEDIYPDQHRVLRDWTGRHVSEVLAIWMTATGLRLIPGADPVPALPEAEDSMWSACLQEFFGCWLPALDGQTMDALVARLLPPEAQAAGANAVQAAFCLAAELNRRSPSPWLSNSLLRRYVNLHNVADCLPRIAAAYRVPGNHNVALNGMCCVAWEFLDATVDEALQVDPVRQGAAASANVRFCLSSPKFRQHLFSRLLTQP